jgi:hypothetical protein
MSTTEPAGRGTSAARAARSVAGPLTRDLVDDAAIFPPGNASLPDAVAAHERHRSSWYGPAIGPLLVRLHDTTALHALLPDGARRAVGLVCPPDATVADIVTGMTDVQRGDRAVVAALEQPVQDRAGAGRLTRAAETTGARAWCEVPAVSPSDGTLDRLLGDVAAAGAHAKYRTGGVHPQAFPDEHLLARFVLGCARRRLPFKLTAGLHHAVRHTARGAGADGHDLEQHGVLNVVNAVAAAGASAGEHDLVALLSDRDTAHVTRLAAGLDTETLVAVRAAFVSFGCCGVTDPLTDLVTLGLLDVPHDTDRTDVPYGHDDVTDTTDIDRTGDPRATGDPHDEETR